MVGAAWTVETHHATVAELHGLAIPPEPARTIRLCRPTDGALVLGSAQPDVDVNHEAIARQGLSLVRRVSGGGAVLIEPWDSLWIDVVLPKSDPLWQEDVGKAFHWVGQAWQESLAALSVQNVTLHEGAMVNTMWSRKFCFAGLGPGECLVDGKKVVGISQRRTRAGALFQSSVLLVFDEVRLVELFELSAEEAEEAKTALSSFVSAINVDGSRLAEIFTETLQNMGI